MPDWSYHPVFRPLLFRLPPATSRDVTLTAMGTLAALPGGPALIETLGQMRPPTCLEQSLWGVSFPSPVGLGAGLDVHAVALPALARFGFGFLEIGPVTVEPVRATEPIERLVGQGAIRYPDLPVNDGLAALVDRLARVTPLPVPLGVRLGYRPGAGAAEAADERRRLAERLAPYAAYFTLDTRGELTGGEWSPDEWAEHLAVVSGGVRDAARPLPLLLCLPPDLDHEAVDRLLTPALDLGVGGVVVTGGVQAEAGGRLVGAPAREQSLRLVRFLRGRWGDRIAIVGSGGVHEPADALRLLAAGATLVQLHSGLVYAGPGLPKRINEALAHLQAGATGRQLPPAAPGGARVEPAHPQPGSTGREFAEPTPAAPASRLRHGWPWIALLGVGMILGGGLASLVAATRVVLPYDETFLGLARAQVAAANDRLLPFMTHDRFTLAGIMVSIGVLYAQLALFGMRRGAAWARQAVLTSATVGFVGFFLFLGFGYFDPLHALVTLLLFPFFLLGLRGHLAAPAARAAPNLCNDRAWLLSQWGQALVIGVGFGLVVAGVTIASVGVTRVFVPEDLAFMRTTAGALRAVSPRLLPLIAHDRAGFGGALVSLGLGVTLTALWGFRQGARWLWWTLLGTGTPGIALAFGVHLAVGYTDAWHLFPVVLAAVAYVLALALSYPYLARTDPGGWPVAEAASEDAFHAAKPAEVGGG
jgi:dihydroorotate dehydrogenase